VKKKNQKHDFRVRLYNEDPSPGADVLENNAPGAPVEFDYGGNSFVVQPANGVYERTKKFEVHVNKERGLKSREGRIQWKRIREGNKENFLDVAAPVAQWALDGKNNGKTHRPVGPDGAEICVLRTYEEKRAETEADIAKMHRDAQKALREAERVRVANERKAAELAEREARINAKQAAREVAAEKQ